MVKFVNAVNEDSVEAKTSTQWTKGENMTGWLIGTKTINSEQYGENTVYQFVEAKLKGEKVIGAGDRFDLMGSSGLNHLLDKYEQGQLLMVTCQGKEKNPKTGRSFVKFVVAHDEENTPMPQTSIKSEEPKAKGPFNARTETASRQQQVGQKLGFQSYSEEEDFEIDWT